MLRIIHTADVHLGARHDDLGEQAAAQRERQFAAFKATVDLALSELDEVPDHGRAPGPARLGRQVGVPVLQMNVLDPVGVPGVPMLPDTARRALNQPVAILS